MKSNSRSTIITIVIIVVLFGLIFVWYRFNVPAPSAPVTSVSSGAGGTPSGPGSQSLILLLESLENLEFDLSVLETSAYRSLQDFTPNIPFPEAKGRLNPFAPLEI